MQTQKKLSIFEKYLTVWVLASIAGGIVLGKYAPNVAVAINSLVMLVLYAPLGSFLLGINAMPIPWKTILFSVLIYVALPLIAGYFTRKWIVIRCGIGNRGRCVNRGAGDAYARINLQKNMPYVQRMQSNDALVQ